MSGLNLVIFEQIWIVNWCKKPQVLIINSFWIIGPKRLKNCKKAGFLAFFFIKYENLQKIIKIEQIGIFGCNFGCDCEIYKFMYKYIQGYP